MLEPEELATARWRSPSVRTAGSVPPSNTLNDPMAVRRTEGAGGEVSAEDRDAAEQEDEGDCTSKNTAGPHALSAYTQTHTHTHKHARTHVGGPRSVARKLTLTASTRVVAVEPRS